MLTTHRCLAIALLVSLSPSVLPRTSFAQAQPDPTIQAAHARFDEGVQFFDKGQFENARAAFLQAYALHKHPAVLINLAQTSLRSGHTLEAARYFTQYIHNSPALTSAQRAEAEKGLAEARTKLGHLEVSAPAGIAVTVDGELAGADGAIAVDVEPGAHTIKGGGETATVTVAPGQSLSVKLAKAALGAIPPPPAPVIGPTTSQPPPQPPTPEAESTPAPSTPAGPSGPGFFSPPSMMTPVWVGAGVGVAGFVTAILFGVFKGAAQSLQHAGRDDSERAAEVAVAGRVRPAEQQRLPHQRVRLAHVGRQRREHRRDRGQRRHRDRDRRGGLRGRLVPVRAQERGAGEQDRVASSRADGRSQGGGLVARRYVLSDLERPARRVRPTAPGS